MSGRPRTYRLHPNVTAKLHRLTSEGNRTAFMESQIMSASDIEIPKSGERRMRRFLWPDEVFEKLKKDAESVGCTQVELLDAIIQSETK